MENSQNENGRSMVEMLGVLAVIGVLSVGGLSAYKFAMKQHQTNLTLSVIDRFVLSYETERHKPEGESVYDESWTGLYKTNPLVEYFCDTYLGSGFCGTVTDRAGKKFVIGNREGTNNFALGPQFYISTDYKADKIGSNIALCIEGIKCKSFLYAVEKQYGDKILGYSITSGGIKSSAEEMCQNEYGGCFHLAW